MRTIAGESTVTSQLDFERMLRNVILKIYAMSEYLNMSSRQMKIKIYSKSANQKDGIFADF